LENTMQSQPQNSPFSLKIKGGGAGNNNNMGNTNNNATQQQ